MIYLSVMMCRAEWEEIITVKINHVICLLFSHSFFIMHFKSHEWLVRLSDWHKTVISRALNIFSLSFSTYWCIFSAEHVKTAGTRFFSVSVSVSAESSHSHKMTRHHDAWTQSQQNQISDKFTCMIHFSFLHVLHTQLTVAASVRSTWARTKHFFSLQQVIFQLTRDLLLMSAVLCMFMILHLKLCDCFDCAISWFRSINLMIHVIYATSLNQESQNDQTICLLCSQTYVDHDSVMRHFHHWLWFWFSSNTCIITCSQRMLLRLCDFSVQHLNWWKAVTNLMMSHV